jgi:ectoine hydroxylase-related dioxygenase (phytanoyl-CoA dioxygenase family)
MLCIDDFNKESGGTFVVPFSHSEEQMPSEQFVEKYGVTIEAKAGSVFLMDSMLIHKAGYNSSQNVRRGLNTIYSTGLLKQQISLSAMMDGKHAEDPFLNVLLGYDANPSENVLEWRKRRYNKLSPEGK